jgi:cytoskeleton protein RodZ
LTDQVITGVGAQLRAAREAAGLTIDEVAAQLRLVPRQIESLEQERFDRLPGPTIARGMVRNYARLLKLDPDPLVERMAPPAAKAPDPGHIAARYREPVPSSTASRRSTPLYLGFSVALLALIGAVSYEWRQENAAPEFVAPIEPQRSDPAAAEIQVSPVVSVAKPVEQPAAGEKPTEAAAEPALPPGTHRLVLRMGEEAWLEVRDGAGRNLVSSLNPAGSERAVRGQPPFQLVIGNASHVELTYDGKPVELKPHIRGEVAHLTLK